MGLENLFCHLTSEIIAEMIGKADHSICYAGPGIQIESAQAMAKVADKLGPEMITVCLDFDERVMRMGYGSLEAVKILKNAKIEVSHSPGFRSALITIDSDGYIFTPTALYLEAESTNESEINALRLSVEQVEEAKARLSPVAKEIAIALATTPAEKEKISSLPVEVGSEKVTEEKIEKVSNNLEVAPPVKFDVVRQVRVFEPYLQYIELSLSGAAIQRHRLTIPPSIQKLGGAKDLEGRLRTTFELIEKSSKLSSKTLEKRLNEIRKNFTPSIGKGHGRVVLKAKKTDLEKTLKQFEKELADHIKAVESKLQQHLDESREQIIEYYVPIVKGSPPEELVGQILQSKPSDDVAKKWLNLQLDPYFPEAETLITEIKLNKYYKDVTFETLNRDDFMEAVKKAFPFIDWDKTYNEFKAAGETQENKSNK